MIRFVPSFIVGAVAIFVASKLFKGVKIKGLGTLLVVALLFGLLNVFLGPLVTLVLHIVLLPAALLTLGLAYLFVGFIANCILLWLTDKLIEDFEIKSGRALLATSLLISIASWLLHMRLH